MHFDAKITFPLSLYFHQDIQIQIEWSLKWMSNMKMEEVIIVIEDMLKIISTTGA